MRGRSLAALVAVAVGCARSGAGTSAPAACEPSPNVLTAGSTGRRLGGEYHLTLVATSGDSVGRRVGGSLTLGASGRPDAVLVGMTDAPVRLVGARQPGDLHVSGDSAPGVLVLDVPGDRPAVMLRLGSRANERGVVRFEGEYTALTVHRIEADGFSGSWRSGDLTERAAGHFCARRGSL